MPLPPPVKMSLRVDAENVQQCCARVTPVAILLAGIEDAAIAAILRSMKPTFDRHHADGPLVQVALDDADANSVTHEIRSVLQEALARIQQLAPRS